MIKNKRIAKMNFLFFMILFCIYFAVTLFLFHRQSVSYAGGYASDLRVYIAVIENKDVGYSFPYPILFWIAKLFAMFISPNHAMAIAVACLNGLAVIILKYYFDRYLEMEGLSSPRNAILSTLFVFSVFLMSMLYPLTYLGHYNEIGENFLYRYLGVFSPNPYHNATYMAARPFAIIAFFMVADILSTYEKQNKWICPKYVMFSIILLLTTMAKPCFTLVLVATVGLIMLWRLLKSHFQGWKAFFQFGIYFIPTFLDLLYQFGGTYTGGTADNEKGIGIGLFTVWSRVCDNIPWAILLATAFPLVVLLFRKKKTPLQPIHILAWQYYGIALIMMALFYEKGYRMEHMNFAWGYMYGLFFLYAVSLLVLIKDTIGRRQEYWKLGLQWGVFGLHLICGIDYFRILINGGLFH